MKTNELNKPGKTPLFEDVSLRIGEMIEKGTYRPGERIPSVRSLSRQMHISINTVIGAYAELEKVGYPKKWPGGGSHQLHSCSRPNGSALLVICQESVEGFPD